MLKFTVHFDGLKETIKKINAASSKAEFAVAYDVERMTRQFVPARSLSQANKAHTQNNKGHINMFVRAEQETTVAIESGNAIVIYPGPYAQYLYNGKVMKGPKHGPKYETNKELVYAKSPHSLAQKEWFDASKSQNLDAWLKTAKRTVIRDLKRK